MRTLGVWVDLALVTGVLMAAAMRWSTPPGTDTGHGLRWIAVGTVAAAALAAALVTLADEKMRFVLWP